jgi:intracellular sulfur oxidation DsrE/DsrF family protein
MGRHFSGTSNGSDRVEGPAIWPPASSLGPVIQVSSDDPETMNLAPNNVMNAQRYYFAKGEKLTVEIVTYGQGITMLRSDTSPVKERISEARTSVPALTLSMCANSKAGAERREGKEIVPLSRLELFVSPSCRNRVTATPVRSDLSALQLGLGFFSGTLIGFSLGIVGDGGSILAVPLAPFCCGRSNAACCHRHYGSGRIRQRRRESLHARPVDS